MVIMNVYVAPSDDFADSPPPSASFSKSATKRKVSEQYSADALRPSKKAKKDRLNSSRVSFAASDDEPASPGMLCFLYACLGSCFTLFFSYILGEPGLSGKAINIRVAVLVVLLLHYLEV